ncbi:reverse transcriptase domain-containing protein [Tanacetum coccineum]|uniref:Reverse transcriptase domain-containing protein n=1 Tax=Tanacetum coccineum TaxID=301880 RepID=A0ABQ5JCS0_9ASTR
MTHLLEKETPFYFSKECIEAFNTLKKNLTEAPILIAPDWNEPFELMCDASDFALGAVLGQRHEKHFRPIHYASKTMNEAESRYTTTEKEMLASWCTLSEKFCFTVMNKCMVIRDPIPPQQADHLSRLESPHENKLDPKEINEKFPLEILSSIASLGWLVTPWFGMDIAKYMREISDQRDDNPAKKKFSSKTFGAPRAIISDRRTHFCNDQFAKVMLKYGVTHRLSTAYYPQTSGDKFEENPTIYASFIKQFWTITTSSTNVNGEVELTASIHGQSKTITEASLRRHLKLEDNGGITYLPNTEIFEQLALIGYATDSDKLTFQKVTRGYSGDDIPLFSSMITAHDTSPSRITSSPSLSPQHTPVSAPSTSQPPITKTSPTTEEPALIPYESPL